MDIVVNKKRKYVEDTRDNGTSEGNDFDESLAKKKRFFIEESTSNEKADLPNCESHVYEYSEIFDDTMVRKRKAAQNRKNVVKNKINDAESISLVDKLRNIKQQSSKKYATRKSCLKDAQISPKIFEQSARVLDEVCSLTPGSKKFQNKIHPLGLVPFVTIQRCDQKKSETNQGAAEHWSMDEDKEEDMFAEPRDDRETVVDFSQWEYETSRRSGESFCGFSDSESQRSKQIGEKCIYLAQVEETASKSHDDTPILRGFRPVEINAFETIVKQWKCKLWDYELNDSVFPASDISDAHIVAEVMSNVNDSSVVSGSKVSVKSEDNYPNEISEAELWKMSCFSADAMVSLHLSQDTNRRKWPVLPDEMVSVSLSQVNKCFTQPVLSGEMRQRQNIRQSDSPNSKSLSESAINLPSTSCSKSPGIGQANSISERSFKKERTLSSREMSNIQNDSPDKRILEDVQKSINSSKLASETGLKKSENICAEDISNIKEETDDKSILQSIKESLDSSKLKTNVPSACGFTTASGRSINISKLAVLKAQRVYSELDVCEASTSTEQTPKCRIEERINEGNPRLSFTAAPCDQSKISQPRDSYDSKVLPESSKVFATDNERLVSVPEVTLAESGRTDESSSIQKKHKSLPATKSSSAPILGFSTAGGRPINISESAIKKAQNVYSEVIKNVEVGDNGNLESDLTESKSSSKITADSPSVIGFTTAARRPIKISESALKKAQNVYSEVIKNVEVVPDDNKNLESNLTESKSSSKVTIDSPNIIGFSTARGRQINVSESALKKAKITYAEESLSVSKEPFDSRYLQNTPEPGNSSKIATDPPSIRGFSTAGGRPIKVSESALKKAKNAWAEESLKISEEPYDIYDAEDTPESSTVIATYPANLCGFSTAGGRSINISKAAVMKAQKAYLELEVSDAISNSEDTPDRKVAEKRKDDPRVNRFQVSAANSSKALFKQANFPLASKNDSPTTRNHDIKHRSTTVTANLTTEFDNFESLNIDDFIDPIEVDQTTKKRKIDEGDDETPLRRDTFVKLKRGRFASELQARKLFLEDTSNEEETLTKRSKSEGALRKSDSPHTKTSPVTPEKILISEEVHASAAALLEDERSNESTEWIIKEPSLVKMEAKSETSKKESPKFSSNINTGETNRFRTEASSSSNKPAIFERNSLDTQPESIPDDLAFDTQFLEDNESCPALETFIAETMKMMEARLAMTRKQDETIRSKRRTKPQHCDGYLYKLRMSNSESRISWKELTKGAAPEPREMSETSAERDVLSVTANSAVSYSFRCADLFGAKNIDKNAEGIKVGDDAFLILDENNRAGVREFERAFLASPGVNPNLIPTGWVKNHYRWIVWKLASMDRVDFNNKCLPRMLTPDRLMFELRYRYDREIYRTQWPPLRRILERNEDASSRIVLCVAGISIKEENVKAPIKTPNTPNSMGGPSYKIKLTDGWYCIDADIDSAMIDCIKSGKVREGTKLMTAGAKAMNLDQGCSVLEIPSDVALKIHTNSTRRVRWNTKLDYYRPNRGPMPLSLKSIIPNGGLISKLIVAVARLYPILYREKLPDGQFVFRNARCDEEAALAYETQHRSKIEEIYANARMEFQSALENKRGREKPRSRNSMEQTASSYRELEEELRERIASKLRECLPSPRDVTPVMKIRVAEGENSAMLTVWSNDRDTTEMFVEGSSVVIYNAFASRQRLNGLHITVGRSSFVKSDAKRQVSYPERIYTPIMEIGEPGFNPVYGEFDTVGIVSSIGPAPHGMKNFETVNLACPKTPEGTSSYLSILFWQGVSSHGYSKILTVGSLVACSNLEWRKNPVKSIPTAYSTERSVFSKNPRKNHLSKAFETLRLQIQEPLVYAASCAAVIEEEIAKKSALRTPGKGTPYKPATSSNTTPGWTPRNSINANSTPVNDSKKVSIKRRIEKLEAYGEAPKLPSIVVNQSSCKVLADFRSLVVTPVRKS